MQVTNLLPIYLVIVALHKYFILEELNAYIIAIRLLSMLLEHKRIGLAELNGILQNQFANGVR
jgi:hypothetical protein